MILTTKHYSENFSLKNLHAYLGRNVSSKSSMQGWVPGKLCHAEAETKPHLCDESTAL